MSDENKSGSKYLRAVPCMIEGRIDVYAVIDAFAVTCPARQHAIKKLLCSGIRGKGDVLQDLREARDAITRAIQMTEAKGVNVMGSQMMDVLLALEQDKMNGPIVPCVRICVLFKEDAHFFSRHKTIVVTREEWEMQGGE